MIRAGAPAPANHLFAFPFFAETGIIVAFVGRVSNVPGKLKTRPTGILANRIMSRTALCIGIASLLAVASLVFMTLRWRCSAVDEVIAPASLPEVDRQLVEFLLLLPIAALIICFFRNMIGLNTFGTFTPALIGLAFRDIERWPGIFVFVAIIFAGWLMRRLLHRLHLLQVSRTSLLLSFVVISLVGFVFLANRFHFPSSHLISLFPLIILTGMIERFWTLEEEDNARASFFTLMNTLALSGCIALVIGMPLVGRLLLRFPEGTGLVIAGQLLLGRYRGYRFTELYRFREIMKSPQRARRAQSKCKNSIKSEKPRQSVLS
ncbi:MAG TPA: 7TM domain-containing protein [Gemmataceae bacterium]|nr:7TM domain-containing protein [Gemmataceae bacterium]